MCYNLKFVKQIFLKNLDLLKNLDFGPRFRKVPIFVKRIRKIPILVKKYFEFCQDFKFPEDVDFGQDFQKISIWVKICENLKFGEIFR